MEGYLSLNEAAQKARMSARHVRKYLNEIPHYRFTARGKIWVDWRGFQQWMERQRVEFGKDSHVVSILRDLKDMKAAS